MNSGFRNLLGGRDTSRFQAYLIAVALQVIVLSPLIAFGVLKPQAPAFLPLGAVVGGVLFGLAMNWGGGCAGGLLYKIGSGTISAVVALVFVTAGYIATESGALKPVRTLIQSVGGSGGSAAMPGLPVWKWWIGVLLAAIVLIHLWRRSPLEAGQRWNSRQTGLAIGAIGVVAWMAASFSGRLYGMAIVPGTQEAFNVLAFSARPGWDLLFILAIPVGAYFSATRKNEFKWSSINGTRIWKVSAGGFVLGMSASLAGGCTVGHSLTGLAVFSAQSALFTMSAIVGAISGRYLEQRFENKL